MSGLVTVGGARGGGVITPKLGLGLSIPGIAAMGGKTAQRLYRQAAFALDARHTPGVISGGNTLQDLSTNALRVANGATGNAKLVLDGRGGKTFQLHGSTTGFAATPDAAAFTPSTALEVVARHTLQEGGVAPMLVSQWNSPQFGWRIGYAVGGQAYIGTSNDGVSASTPGVYNSTVSAVAVPGVFTSTLWTKWTFESDNGAGNARATFSYAADTGSSYLLPVAWTVHGTLNSANVHTIHNSTADIHIGRQSNGSFPILGQVHRVILRTALDGPNVRDFFPDRDAQFGSLSWASPTGESWSITQGGTDSSDALFLPDPSQFGVSRYVRMSAEGVNQISTPSTGATNDVDVVFRADVPEVTTRYLFGNYGANGSWMLGATAGGAMLILHRDNAGGVTTPYTWNRAGTLIQSSAVGTPVWWRITRTASTGVWTLQVAPDSVAEPGSFPAALTPTAATNITGTLNSTAAWFWGNGPYGGKIFNTKLRRTIGSGAWELDWDASRDTLAADKSTFTALTGQTITINRSVSPSLQTVVVTQDNYGWLFGADDYVQLLNDALFDLGSSGVGTLVLVVEHQRALLVGSATYIFDNSNTATTPGIRVFSSVGSTLAVGWRDDAGGTASRDLGAAVVGGTEVITAFTAAATLAARRNGTTTGTVARPAGAITPTVAGRLAQRSNSLASGFSGIMRGMLWFDGILLSDADVAAIEADFGVAA